MLQCVNHMDRKVEIKDQKYIFNDFFKIEECKVSYEKFDGSRTPFIRRLCFERGDSVAALVLNRDDQKILLVNQFKYPTFKKGPGWITEIVAGMLGPDEKDTVQIIAPTEPGSYPYLCTFPGHFTLMKGQLIVKPK